MPHSTALPVLKTHGSKNDIFVIDGSPAEHFAANEIAYAVRRLCDRKAGLGGDGVYFVEDAGDGTARAWFYNSDGSPSLLCGNGMRAAGRLLLDRHDAESAVVRTGPYAFIVSRAETTSHGVRQVAVELPAVNFTPADPIVTGVSSPFIDQLLTAFHPIHTVSALAVPNSHLVSVIDSYDEADLIATGRRVAATPTVFPIGANVSLVQQLATEDEVFIATFERGAGLTPSCGSGVAASRAVLSRLGLAAPDLPITVRNPGGPAVCWLIEKEGSWQPILQGNASFVYRTEIDTAALLRDQKIDHAGEAFLEEIMAYAELAEDNSKVLTAAGVCSSVD
jgi:diaminopimelate epimerase